MNEYREVNSGQMMRPGWAQGPSENGWTGVEYPIGYQNWGGSGQVMSPLRKLGWYESQPEVTREAAGRVVVVGPAGVGKRRLLRELRGWPESEAPICVASVSAVNADSAASVWAASDSAASDSAASANWAASVSVEDWGFWTVVDLPSEAPGGDCTRPTMAADQVQSADLVLFVASGLAEIRILARLRASGRPLVVAVLRQAKGKGSDARLLAQRVGQEVIDVETTSQEALNRLLSAMVAANPALLVPLGRELPRWRRKLAKRLVGETALMCGFAGLEPVPLMDVPVQIMAQTRLTLRLLAMYGHHSPSPIRRETLVLVGCCLLVRIACEQALKVLPIAGWLLAGVASGTGTWLLGWLLVLSLSSGDFRLVIGDWRRKKGRISC